ncbi:hypothetical protein ABW19_dt0203968 [Dactylella cylindrospora]|nr:hypothetical protein ABW19_dt0203968 [Dactylella cylindrospora]
MSPVSRGAVVSSFLTSSDTEFEAWVDSFEGDHHLASVPDMDQVGGFSMLCGQLSRDQDERVKLENLVVISNRRVGFEEGHVKRMDSLDPLAKEVYGLSNSAFCEPWPKVLQGKQLLGKLVEAVHQGADEQSIIDDGLNILSQDGVGQNKEWESLNGKLGLLPNSIFIPAFDTENDAQLKLKPDAPDHEPQNPPSLGLDSPTLYGTQKQTVVIFYSSGKVRYVERTLFSQSRGQTFSGASLVNMEFDLEL